MQLYNLEANLKKYFDVLRASAFAHLSREASLVILAVNKSFLSLNSIHIHKALNHLKQNRVRENKVFIMGFGGTFNIFWV